MLLHTWLCYYCAKSSDLAFVEISAALFHAFHSCTTAVGDCCVLIFNLQLIPCHDTSKDLSQIVNTFINFHLLVLLKARQIHPAQTFLCYAKNPNVVRSIGSITWRHTFKIATVILSYQMHSKSLQLRNQEFLKLESSKNRSQVVVELQ